MVKAQVYVTLKKGILDPQGRTVFKSLNTLGYDGVSNVRMGKFVELFLDPAPRSELETKIEEICDKLLANPNIEDYRWEIVEDGEA